MSGNVRFCPPGKRCYPRFRPPGLPPVLRGWPRATRSRPRRVRGVVRPLIGARPDQRPLKAREVVMSRAPTYQVVGVLLNDDPQERVVASFEDREKAEQFARFLHAGGKYQRVLGQTARSDP